MQTDWGCAQACSVNFQCTYRFLFCEGQIALIAVYFRVICYFTLLGVTAGSWWKGLHCLFLLPLCLPCLCFCINSTDGVAAESSASWSDGKLSSSELNRSWVFCHAGELNWVKWWLHSVHILCEGGTGNPLLLVGGKGGSRTTPLVVVWSYTELSKARSRVTLEATEHVRQVSMSSSTFGDSHTALGVCIRDFVEMCLREKSLR